MPYVTRAQRKARRARSERFANAATTCGLALLYSITAGAICAIGYLLVTYNAG